jgi:imidazolonepropionase-like amidohydrolase
VATGTRIEACSVSRRDDPRTLCAPSWRGLWFAAASSRGGCEHDGKGSGGLARPSLFQRSASVGMIRHLAFWLGAFIAVVIASNVAWACDRPAALAIGPVNIIDVETGAVRADRALLLEDGKISREIPASRMGALPAHIQRYDGQHGYLMPGLIDMHVHALWDPTVPAPFFHDFLVNGVTGVRDMGGDLELALEVRRQLQNCEMAGPHLWVAGPFLDGPEPVDPSLSLALANRQAARRAVRMLHRRGVDFLKVYSLLPPDVLSAVLDEARKYGLKVVGHVPAMLGPRGPALRMDGMEHLAIETGGLCDAANPGQCEAVFRQIVRRRIAQTPTLVAREVSTSLASPNRDEPFDVARFPEAVRRYWQSERRATRARATPEWLSARALSLRHARWMTQVLSSRGAILLAGSDAGTPYVRPGVSLHDELGLLVEAGLSPRAALASATVSPARFLGARDRGRIGPGMVADLILLRENPLVNIANTRSIVAVFHDGVRVESFESGRRPLK